MAPGSGSACGTLSLARSPREAYDGHGFPELALSLRERGPRKRLGSKSEDRCADFCNSMEKRPIWNARDRFHHGPFGEQALYHRDRTSQRQVEVVLGDSGGSESDAKCRDT